MLQSTYERIRPSLQTGDIVLFRGEGIISSVIRWFCSLISHKYTKYSHIGTIVCDSDHILVFESTSIRGGVKGVRLTALSDVLANYDGRITIRRLHFNRTTELLHGLAQFISNNIGKPYERHLIELIEASTKLGFAHVDKSDFFCSELVAAVYQLWGLLGLSPDASKYSPEDFCYGGLVDSKLKKPAFLGAEILIK